MNVIIATQEEPFYVPIFFSRFLAATETNVVGAVIGRPLGSFRAALRTIRDHWRLYGPRLFVVQGLRVARLGLADRLRADRLPPCSVRSAMRQRGVPVWPVETIKDPRFVERAVLEHADVLVSVACPQIVPERVLSAFPHGGINFHLGPLPRYRGMMPLFWCLLHGERESAVTVHRMDRYLDNGPILAQQFFPIDDVPSLDAAYRRAIDLGPGVLEGVLRDLRTGAVQERANPKESATYFGFPSGADARAFRRSGRKFW